MKTKKVGKIVSLLVAIVLVATIMIPAASVLADNGSNAVTSGVDWTGEDVKIIGGDNAYGDLDAYLASLTPNSDKVYNIRLDADVELPKFGVYKNKNGDTAPNASEGIYYSYATYGVFKDAYKKKEGKDVWNASDNPKFGINELLGESGSTYGASYDILDKNPSISTNPYKTVFKVAKPGDTTTRAFLNYDLQCVGKYVGKDDLYESLLEANKERFERLDTAQKKLMTGARGNEGLGASAGNDTATYTEYDEAMLCVKEGVTVCLNLNGHKVSGLNSLGSPYTGSPNYQTSIFVVRGKLTVVDEHTTNAGKAVGMITGGTGSIYGKPQYRPNGDSNYDLVDSGMYQGVAYYGVGLGTNATNEWGDAYIIKLGEKAPDGNKWPIGVNGHSAESWTHSVGNYRIYTNYYSRFYANVKETHGGGVYVAPGASFTLLSGKISGNSAWRLNDTKNTFIFDTGASAAACGGGVYVDEGATFTMKGGEISNNAVRVYNKKDDNSDATAYGGGVYLAKKAVMNMTGGKIVENASYAETFDPTANSPKSARSYGAGIYVHAEATCNIIGEDAESGATTLEMVKNFPSVSNNSCGALGRKTSTTEQDITVEGGGIYNSGTLNLRNALVSANDFAEGDIDVPNASEKCTLNNAIHVKRDEYLPEDQRTITYSDGKTATLPGTGTGLALYVLDYWEDGRPRTYITRLDDRFNENLELVTEAIQHEIHGIYGTMHGNEESAIFSNGAGICLNEKATIVIGERVWVIDNYDLVTTGHKAFKSVRDYTRTWQQSKNITDDRVVKTIYDGTGLSRGANYTDPAGGYVYNEYVAPESGKQNNKGQYTHHHMDGYAFSDTTDDIYLPDGKVIYKGGSLYETKIGVNYWDMVNADGKVTEKKEAERGKGQAGSRAGNRVLLVDGNVLGNLDRKIWTGDSTTPVQSDIQFFYLNDNNKNWERYKNYKKAANDLWYDYDKNAYNYQLPESDKGRIGGADRDLCDLDAINSKDWEARYRVRAISTSNPAINRDASPYEGYINYNVEYPAGRWAAGQQAWPGVNAYDIHKNGGYWNYYNKPTYRISDPTWSPDNKEDFRPKNGDFSNAIVNFPQRAYPVTAQMKNELPSSYLKAKYMDYKVVYDDNQFGTSTEPVIRLGTYSDPASNDTIRKMFVTVNFDEADIHFYGQSKDSIVYNSGSAATNEQTYTFTTKNTAFANVDASALFYGANRVKGTINIAKIVPDYESYGKGDILNALRAAASADAESSLSYDDEDKKNESIDLYFKGWKYYTSYGDGPKVETLSNSVEERTIKGTSLSYRGYFPVNLANIFNPNINSQPCPSLTAIWYTKEELAAARQNLSACKAQLILGTDGRIYIRVISVLGAYGKDRNNLQPIQASDANSSLSSLYYNAPTFVASKLNATPTLEGGYKATVNKGNIAAGENFSARVVKKIICNDDEKNTFTIDIYDYISGKENKENDVWVKFINSNPEYKKANNSKSNTYVSFMWTNIDTGLTLAQISNADGSDYSDAAKEVWFVTPCIELTTDQAGYEHDSYYYGASRGFSIASLDAGDLNKLLKQAKAMN
ncbi:MAG: hypothetical protein MSA52_08230 [Oscillospiraceae bacterium]|nr:hypothetical protein [Oscillospiraceae bacterium]